VRGTATGTIPEADRFTDVYVFIGGNNPVYGRHFDLEASA